MRSRVRSYIQALAELYVRARVCARMYVTGSELTATGGDCVVMAHTPTPARTRTCASRVGTSTAERLQLIQRHEHLDQRIESFDEEHEWLSHRGV